MRVERRGGAPDLQAAFTFLVRDHLKGRVLDDDKDVEAVAGRFPDFACFRDLLLIEMKHLEADQSDRLNEVFHTKVDKSEMPYFYASRDAQHIIDQVSNGAEIKSVIAGKLSRTIEGLLSSANDQFASYRLRHPRKNSVSLCVILNAALREFSPDLVNHALFRKMRKDKSGTSRFPSIDAVIYVTEKHFKPLPDGRIAFAMNVYESLETEGTWKQPIVERVVEAWSQMRTGGTTIWSEDPTNFDLLEDIPETMSRSDGWYLEYRRNPYMRTLPVNRLRVLFNRCLAMTCLTFVKGNWPKPPHGHTEEHLRVFTHLIEESNQRGLDIREFATDKLTPAERVEVYAGLPDELVQKLNKQSPAPH
jgi:hypothetical protein